MSAKNHNIVIPIPTLKRQCCELGVFTRRNQTGIDHVMAFAQEELRGKGQMQGHRSMHCTAAQRGLVVSQETIKQILKALDPHRVEMRRAHHLRRRQYTTHLCLAYDLTLERRPTKLTPSCNLL